MTGNLTKPITAVIELTRKIDVGDTQGILATAVYRLQKMLGKGECQRWRVLSRDGEELAKGP